MKVTHIYTHNPLYNFETRKSGEETEREKTPERLSVGTKGQSVPTHFEYIGKEGSREAIQRTNR